MIDFNSNDFVSKYLNDLKLKSICFMFYSFMAIITLMDQTVMVFT